MARLFLIKHARPQIDPQVPSERWSLGPEGRDAATRLADRLRGRGIGRLYTSTEPKALETAQIVGQSLELSAVELPDLHEHDRSNVPHMDTREFISLMALFFKQPDRLVLGEETADEAYERFAAAIDGILERESGDAPVAVVSHGTVIALLAQHRAKQDPFAVWRRMGLPSFMVLETRDGLLVESCDRL
ncbi:MAG TPA: histidine phosphatase family protein [Tepidisphaeraceae bacterium]|jgi:broad specificity phosphatase PhoE